MKKVSYIQIILISLLFVSISMPIANAQTYGRKLRTGMTLFQMIHHVALDLVFMGILGTFTTLDLVIGKITKKEIIVTTLNLKDFQNLINESNDIEKL